MFEIREVLRLWLRGEGYRAVSRLSGRRTPEPGRRVYVLKQRASRELLDDIRTAMGGGTVFEELTGKTSAQELDWTSGQGSTHRRPRGEVGNFRP